jgi:hypothetical protein
MVRKFEFGSEVALPCGKFRLDPFEGAFEVDFEATELVP